MLPYNAQQTNHFHAIVAIHTLAMITSSVMHAIKLYLPHTLAMITSSAMHAIKLYLPRVSP